MAKSNFSRTECIRALTALGFIEKTPRKGGHDKYLPPEELKGSPVPFIMVPRHRKITCQKAILQELRAMGGTELEERFLARM